MPGNRQGLPPSAGSNSKKDPSGVNEAGCYSGLRKPFPKELNLRLIFTLRPDFSEVWMYNSQFYVQFGDYTRQIFAIPGEP
jgi:hypothetical protein